MSIDLNQLHTMDRASLDKLAIQVGVRTHHKQADKTVVENIMNKVTQPAPHVPEVVSEDAVEKVVEYCSPEQIQEAIAKIKAGQTRLHDKYDDISWRFMFVNDAGRILREDSGTLWMPLSLIKFKASEVAKGPRALRGMPKEHFEGGAATGPNAYTNVVLA